MSMAKTSGAVKRYHDRVARRYDAIYDDAFWTWHDGLTWDHLKGFLPTEQRAEVVDLGCGAGKVCYSLSQKVGPEGQVSGIDFNDKMLSVARKYQDEMQAIPRCSSPWSCSQRVRRSFASRSC